MSEFMSLNLEDIKQSLKTALFTFLTGALTTLMAFFYPAYQSLQAGQMPSLDFEWVKLLIGILASLSAAIYTVVGNVLKRFLQTPEGKIPVIDKMVQAKEEAPE